MMVMVVIRTQGLLPLNPFSSKQSFPKSELSLSLLKTMPDWVLHSLTWSHSHTPLLSALTPRPSFRSFNHRLLAHAIFSPRSFPTSCNIPVYKDNFYPPLRSCLNCHFLREVFSLSILIPQICPFMALCFFACTYLSCNSTPEWLYKLLNLSSSLYKKIHERQTMHGVAYPICSQGSRQKVLIKYLLTRLLYFLNMYYINNNIYYHPAYFCKNDIIKGQISLQKNSLLL